jgi:hypothetical protein
MATVIHLDAEERSVLVQALDRYVAALAALRTLDNRAEKAAETDQITAIAASLRDRLLDVAPDKWPRRARGPANDDIRPSDGDSPIAPLRRVG